MEELTLRERPLTAKPLRTFKTRCVYQEYDFDQHYLDRLKEGDPQTELHFTSHFGKLLLMKLRMRVRSRELAEDARQETFLRVLQVIRNKGGIQNPARLGSFVNAVCENVLLEFFRSGASLQQWHDGDIEPPSPGSSVESELISQELKDSICAQLGELSKNDREMLRKVFLEERDKDEICRELGIDRNNLRVRVHRALRRFRLAVAC